MQLKHNFIMLYTRLQTMLRDRIRKPRRHVEISAPYDVKHKPVNLPGVSQEELSILREKAVASRIGVLELRPEFPSGHEYYKISRPAPRPRPAASLFNAGEA
ncbi:uncharacterized protein UV8b_04440 [Ustilaginoidea virens]|uniref:Uncharacterized protein n=1 Tax=Ustilaginoidea virens TaxID=1159556 RepID=A0A8E5HRH5_USTVR|nr:uncharacterized protein UV8b_04440 [Ustilaginoidea virens]QUC20199.1 hypothetical protein UV8b_04440 [Ustilaginoidea virens]